jgi:arginase
VRGRLDAKNGLDKICASVPGGSLRARAFHVITVPFNAAGLTSGVARGPAAIVRAGLLEWVGKVAPVELIEVPIDEMDPRRGPSGLIAEDALVTTLTRAAEIIERAMAGERFPLVVAGDCPMLLAGLEATRRVHGSAGLMFVDGHEDAWDPWVSPTGESSDCEMGIALGDVALPTGLDLGSPAVAQDDTAFLGPRDRQEILDGGWQSLADRVPFVDGETLAASSVREVAREHAERLRDKTKRWWLHVDLDILSTSALSAVDYPQPGGLSWEQLEELTDAAVGAGGCVGASVVIYNPDLDRDGTGADRVARFGGSIARSAAR